jgi:hypothetical protein
VTTFAYEITEPSCRNNMRPSVPAEDGRARKREGTWVLDKVSLAPIQIHPGINPSLGNSSAMSTIVFCYHQ